MVSILVMARTSCCNASMNCNAQPSPVNVRLNGSHRLSDETMRYSAAHGTWFAIGIVFEVASSSFSSGMGGTGASSSSSSFSLGVGGGGIGACAASKSATTKKGSSC